MLCDGVLTVQFETVLHIAKLGRQDFGELVSNALAHFNRDFHHGLDFVAG